MCERRAEYYTVSSSGVMHIVPGVQTDFIPLGTWMRDTSIYSLLRQMRFFKHYLTLKMFSEWRVNVRVKLYRSVRNKIEHKLFLAIPAFNPAMMALAALSHELRETSLVAVNRSQQCTLEEFVETQTTHRYESYHRVD